MIRRMVLEDFPALWDLAQSGIDYRLKPDKESARNNFRDLLANASNLAEGEFVDGKLVGAVIACGRKNGYAQKGFANMELWFGRIELLDRAIAWWEGRPMYRFLSLQFPCNVRSGMYKLLARRGFERKGDMNLRWR